MEWTISLQLTMQTILNCNCFQVGRPNNCTPIAYIKNNIYISICVIQNNKNKNIMSHTIDFAPDMLTQIQLNRFREQENERERRKIYVCIQTCNLNSN